MTKKERLIEKAVNEDLGSEKDLEQLDVKDLEELLSDNAPPEQEKPKKAEADPKPAGEYEHEHPGMTTVKDLKALGRIKVAKSDEAD